VPRAPPGSRKFVAPPLKSLSQANPCQAAQALSNVPRCRDHSEYGTTGPKVIGSKQRTAVEERKAWEQERATIVPFAAYLHHNAISVRLVSSPRHRQEGKLLAVRREHRVGILSRAESGQVARWAGVDMDGTVGEQVERDLRKGISEAEFKEESQNHETPNSSTRSRRVVSRNKFYLQHRKMGGPSLLTRRLQICTATRRHLGAEHHRSAVWREAEVILISHGLARTIRLQVSHQRDCVGGRNASGCFSGGGIEWEHKELHAPAVLPRVPLTNKQLIVKQTARGTLLVGLEARRANSQLTQPFTRA
jgi:hypothetical protein